jgi:hypothetical protein
VAVAQTTQGVQVASYDLSARLQRLERLTTRPKLYEATVAEDASGMGSAIRVVIQGFDGGRQRWPVDFWMPRGNRTPKRGDQGVVSMTDSNRIVLVAWSPGRGLKNGAGPYGDRAGAGEDPTTADISSGTPKEIIDNIVLPIAAANGITRTPEQVAAANGDHGSTGSGNRSDHEGPPNVAWAADISNSAGTSRTVADTTPEMDAVASALAVKFGLSYSQSGGIFSRTEDGYRYQLIYRIDLGADGNHYNHVHFGVKRV